MTIKERAYQAVGHPLPKKGEMHVPIMLQLEERTFVNGYIKGYRDSIDKACEWLSRCESIQMRSCDIELFCKAIGD